MLEMSASKNLQIFSGIERLPIYIVYYRTPNVDIHYHSSLRTPFVHELNHNSVSEIEFVMRLYLLY